jgi:hypothetical protein
VFRFRLPAEASQPASRCLDQRSLGPASDVREHSFRKGYVDFGIDSNESELIGAPNGGRAITGAMCDAADDRRRPQRLAGRVAQDRRVFGSSRIECMAGAMTADRECPLAVSWRRRSE